MAPAAPATPTSTAAANTTATNTTTTPLPHYTCQLASLNASEIDGCEWSRNINANGEWVPTLSCSLQYFVDETDSTATASAPSLPPKPASLLPPGCNAALTVDAGYQEHTPQSVQRVGEAIYRSGFYDIPIINLVGITWTAAMIKMVGFYAGAAKHLRANGIGLKRLDETTLDSFTSLVSIELVNNSLAVLPPRTFSGLTHLVEIDLHNNLLQSVAANAFANTSRLSHLHLSKNRLQYLPPGTLQAAPTLIYVSLAGNFFPAVPVGLFTGLRELKYISFEENIGLASFAKGALDGLTKLEVIRLAQCRRLTLLPHDLLKDLVNLREITLDATNVASLPTFSSPSVERLQVSSTRVQHIALPNVTSLELLDVSENPQLKTVDFHAQLKIEVMDVSRTGVHPEDIDCETLGARALGLRHMPDEWKADETLKKCWRTTRRKMLDISYMTGLENVDSINTQLQWLGSVEKVKNETFKTRTTSSSPYYDIASIPMLIVQGGSVECGIALAEKSAHFYNKETQTFPAYSTFMSAMYTCTCVAGHKVTADGKCVKRRAWMDYSGSQAIVVVSSIIVGMVVVLGIARLRRHMRGMSRDLTLHKRLLEDAEDEVIALRSAWEIDAGDVRLLERIDVHSPGAFGAVYRGSWDDLLVAVKVLREGMMDLDPTTAAEFEKEAEVMLHARHPNLVRFFGAGQLPSGDPFLVLELVARGSLREILAAEEAGRRTPLASAMRTQLALDVIRGMAHIHSLGLVHRDLKSGNVLVTESWRGKVADFGSIRGILLRRGDRRRALEPGNVTEDTELAGSFFYLSPEVLRDGARAYNFPSDVWSFGVLLWELWVAITPDLLEQHGRTGDGFVLTSGAEVLLQLLESGARLELKEGQAPAWARATVMTCLALTPQERPTFASMESTLAMELEKSANKVMKDGSVMLSEFRRE